MTDKTIHALIDDAGAFSIGRTLCGHKGLVLPQPNGLFILKGQAITCVRGTHPTQGPTCGKCFQAAGAKRGQSYHTKYRK